MIVFPKGAENYFTFVSGGRQTFGVVKGGVCYAVGDGGALTAVAYGDEYLVTPDDRVTVRRGQKTFSFSTEQIIT